MSLTRIGYMESSTQKTGALEIISNPIGAGDQNNFGQASGNNCNLAKTQEDVGKLGNNFQTKTDQDLVQIPRSLTCHECHIFNSYNDDVTVEHSLEGRKGHL